VVEEQIAVERPNLRLSVSSFECGRRVNEGQTADERRYVEKETHHCLSFAFLSDAVVVEMSTERYRVVCERGSNCHENNVGKNTSKFESCYYLCI
jgi:hypothetical protein